MANMSGESQRQSEDTPAILGSPSFTPTNRDKPLPPIEKTLHTPDKIGQSPMLWYTPSHSGSPLQESSLLNLYDKAASDMVESQGTNQWDNISGRLQQTRLDSFSESVMSCGSSSQIDSTRLSCSTLGSSGLQTGSESSVATSPLGYGFALGSPLRDQRTQDGASQSSHHVGPSPIGLGLTDSQAATAAPVVSGSFSHHRRPSWTLQNIMAKVEPGSTTDTASAEEDDKDSIMPMWPVSIPPRGASRSRSNSQTSSNTRLGKSSMPFDETRPLPTRSASSHSMTSTADSSFSHASSHVSPRSSSLLKKSKSRPKLTSKASEPALTTLRPLPPSSVARAKAGSVGDAQVRRGLYGCTTSGSKVTITGDSSSSMRDLHDYLAYTAESAMDVLPISPIKPKAMEVDERILDLVAGITLEELEKHAGPKTTHLLLSGCQDSALPDFLDRVLPVVGPSLLVLDLSKTNLVHLPDSIVCCINLEELNISNIAFSRPWKCHALSQVTTLRALLADACNFATLPAEIAQLQMLRTLFLQHNHLSHLPSWLHRLGFLQQLYLEGNPFQGPWQQVCEALSTSQQTADTSLLSARSNISIKSPASYRPALERAPDSAPGRVPGMQGKAACEEYEEIADDWPTTAPVVHSIRREERRPSMFRKISISSAGTSSPLEDNALGMVDVASSSSSARRPSQSGEATDKKWGTLIRKLGRKASYSHVPLSAPSSITSSPVKSRSASLQQPQTIKATQPLTPMEWHEGSGDSSWSSSQSSYLATSHCLPDAHQQRKVQALLQYLRDLDDLSALRLGPPGAVQAMETSMASAYSTPSKDMAAMDRSGSETSRESMHSTSTSSSASQVPSDQSDRRTSAPAVAQASKDDAQRRIRILQEIVATEETYIRGLQELVDIYVVPSAAIESSSGQAVVPAADRRRVFANVEAIYHFHQTAFLPALRQVTKSIINASEGEVQRQRADAESYNALSASITEQVAGVFTKHAAYLRMYSAYVNNVDAAQKRVGHWKLAKTADGGTSPGNAADGSSSPILSPKERKRIKLYLQKAKLDPRHSQLSLETYLHLPVQRIPRYRLLFEDLVRSCPTHRLQDPTAITRALDAISSLATQMNESKRQSENDRKLLEWQARIKGQFASPLLQPHRKLIRDGELTLKRVVMRTTAFHMAKSQWTEEECLQSTQCDGAVTDTDLGIVQVDCLDQSSMDKSVHILLCNDITVIVIKGDPFSVQNSQVDLFAVLRITGPVELVGQTTLRVVDPKHILYFSASSPSQAQDWKAALMSVHQEPRTLKVSTAL